MATTNSRDDNETTQTEEIPRIHTLALMREVEKQCAFNSRSVNEAIAAAACMHNTLVGVQWSMRERNAYKS
jgi:hypothetical protein